MPVVIKSYYETTPIDEGTLIEAIRSAKNQEKKVYELFKKYVCMTAWDLYDVHTELVGPIHITSIRRAIDTLQKNDIIQQIGTIPGDEGRPVFLFRLIDADKDVIERKLNTSIPKYVKLDVILTIDGQIDIEKMVEQLDDKLNLLSETFNI